MKAGRSAKWVGLATALLRVLRAWSPSAVLAQEAIDALTTPRKDGSMPRAAIITEHGRKDQRPIRVIGGSDIAVLMEAVDT